MAEGGLGEITGIVTRIRELAIQAASDVITDSERYMANLEVVLPPTCLDQKTLEKIYGYKFFM